MTEIEDTLVRVLTAEADWHEPPVFDARRIAEGAARRTLWRRPLFAVVAGAIAVAGGGGAAVVAGAGHSSGGRVTVTFQNKAFAHLPMPLVDGDVEGWVRQTIAAEGLKDTDVFLNTGSDELVVHGRAADLPKLEALLGTPIVLQFPEIIPSSLTRCMACEQRAPDFVLTGSGAFDYHVVSANAEPPAADAGPVSRGWRVTVRLDAESAAMLAGVARSGGRIGVMVDRNVRDQWEAAGLNSSGELAINGNYTEQEAQILAARLSRQGPPGVEGTTVTVSTR